MVLSARRRWSRSAAMVARSSFRTLTSILLIVIEESTREALSPTLEGFVGACWDLGLEIGHSVRSIDECLSESARDLTVQTSLLEMRSLAGSRRLFTSLRKKLAEQLDPKEFFQGKMLELQQRHAKYEDTPYSLEPNTKESPGGLRDLHVIRWTALAAGYGHSWQELVRSGMLTPNEQRAVRRSETVIKRVRAALHICAKRRDDRLVFDLQTQAAEKNRH